MSETQHDWQTHLAEDGYVVLANILTTEEIARTIAAWDDVRQRHQGDPAILASESGSVSGARDLLRLWPGVIELARLPTLRQPLLTILGAGGGLVRGLYFDKPPGSGWALPWHKDYNIAVREHGPMGRMTKPTIKAGVPHVEALPELLEQMVTARIHLDDMTPANGPLRVIPGSHRSHRTDHDPARSPIEIHCHAGDVLLMRPLLTHASSHPSRVTDCHRRIVHLECAPRVELPDNYQWHDFILLN